MQVAAIQAQVLKRFDGARTFEPGEVLDPSGWPPNRLKQLLRFRYVQLVTPVAAAGASALPLSEAGDTPPPRRRRGRPRKSEAQNEVAL